MLTKFLFNLLTTKKDKLIKKINYKLSKIANENKLNNGCTLCKILDCVEIKEKYKIIKLIYRLKVNYNIEYIWEKYYE